MPAHQSSPVGMRSIAETLNEFQKHSHPFVSSVGKMAQCVREPVINEFGKMSVAG